MSSVRLPSIQTNFAVYASSSSPPSSPPSTARRAHRSVSPGSAAPAMTFQTRSYSTSSLLSTYSSSSERSLSQSPGPATPCGMMSRSPSFTDQQASISGTHYNDSSSNNCINNKPLFSVPVHQQPYKQAHHYSSYAGHPACPPLPSLHPSSHRYNSSTARHHPYQPHTLQQQHPRHPMQSTSSDHGYHHSQRQEYTLPPLNTPHHQQHWSPAYTRTPPSPSSPQESTYSYPARDRSDHNPSHDHQGDLYQQHHQQHQQRSSFGYKSSNTSNYFHSTSPPPYYPLISTPGHEDRGLALNPSTTPPCSPLQAICEPLPVGEGGDDGDEGEEEEDEEDDEGEGEEKDDADRIGSPSSFMSRSRSFSRDGSSVSPEPSASSGYLGSMSDASVSTTSLLSSSTSSSSSSSSCSASNISMTPVPTTTQLLLCPVCSRAFKPSKNQNCNLRRHLKNVHNMSPAIHPRKCKWDSLPDGRVKDDKDRKERTRKSKRLWARKFRQRRKVEEAAVVLSMLSQAL